MADADRTIAAPRDGILRKITRACVRYAERYIPDPYLYALLLTFITVAAALIWTSSTPTQIVTAWYDGVFAILAFAMQICWILDRRRACAAPAVKRLLHKLASIPTRQSGAAVTVFLAGAFGSWLNWGFGLVAGALVAREVAKRIRDVDFGLLVAAAYMGNIVWASGLSSSIALASATPGSALNLIEKVTGRTAGLNETIFTAYNLVPTILMFLLIPLMLAAIAPPLTEMKRADPALLAGDEIVGPEPKEHTFATRLENAWPITLLLVAMGLLYQWNVITTRGFTLDINGMIFIALMLG
jgi:short-chain fatty acids transporter